jgi:hypothetical protein
MAFLGLYDASGIGRPILISAPLSGRPPSARNSREKTALSGQQGRRIACGLRARRPRHSATGIASMDSIVASACARDANGPCANGDHRKTSVTGISLIASCGPADAVDSLRGARSCRLEEKFSDRRSTRLDGILTIRSLQ